MLKKLMEVLGTSKKEDVFIGLVSEAGASVSSFMDECSMSFTFCAYTKNDSEVIAEDIYVTRDVPSINTAVKGIDSLSIIKIAGKEITFNDQKRIQLYKVLQSGISHNELEKILAKRKEPVIYNSATLGKFQLDRRLDWYEGKPTWRGKSIDVFLAGDLNRLETTEKTANSILKHQQEWDLLIKEKIGEELLALKNESWLEEDDKPLSKQEFINRIFLETITVYDAEEFEMCFNDGDTFWGHAILVSGDLNKNIEHVGIAG